MTTVGDLINTTSQPSPKMEGGTTVVTPVSAVPTARLTAEQRSRRYEELRKRLGKPRLEVVGDPSKHYFWAPRGDSNELDRLDLLGYSIVREPNAEAVLANAAQPKIRAAGLKIDGTYVLGDVILTECDIELYEFLLLESEQKSNNIQQSARDNFTFEAEKSGVPTFEVDKSKVGRK
jgi:hypothetical protein